MAQGFDAGRYVRPALALFKPYDPAFSPCAINLSANENTHPLPSGLAQAMREALCATPLNRYPDPMANDLRDELSAWHNVRRSNVCVGNGGDELLFNLLFAFGGPGRTLVVCPPCFEEYQNFARMCETNVVEVWRREADYSVDADALIEAVRTARAEDAAPPLVMLTSPNNPTGDLLDADVVRRLLDETDALVLVDEAYVEFSGAQASFVSWVAHHPRVMVLRTLSKAFALAGLRVGYLVADPAIIDVLAAVRQIYSEDVLAQAAARVVVERRDELALVIASIVAERERLTDALAALPGVHVWPSAANFLLVRVDDASTIRARLRDEHSVLVRDFSYAPGLANCLRITVGMREENDALLAALVACRA